MMVLKSEKAFIGSILIDPDCLEIARQYVKSPDYFQELFYGQVYEVILRMSENERAIDISTVYDALPDKENAYLLGEIVSQTPTSAHIEDYAKNVRDNYARRKLKIALASFDPLNIEKYKTTTDMFTYLKKSISDTYAIVQEKAVVTTEELVLARLDEYDKWQDGNRRINSTGYYDLDDIISGLELTSNIVIAGRPSMGKTSLALNIALNVARKGKQVIFFSLETSKEKLMDRLMVIESGVDAFKAKNRLLEPDEYLKFMEAGQRIINMPILILDDIYSTMEMRSTLAKQALRGPTELVVVDYLQLVDDDRKFENRNTEVGYYTRQMAQIAKKFNLTVIALSQLSRSVENRSDKRPMLSDLYESGGVEANADIVVFIYRDEYYNPDTEKKGVCELGVAKNRDGPVGKCKLLFVPQSLTFKNLARN
jgi:replicative DNA helicase